MLAIQGHPTRGKEVIQILENLGSKNGYDQSGSNEDFVYFINSVGLIYSVALQMCSNERRIYTLEEFEKEFPFKIGDEVIFPVKIGWASGKVTGLTYVGDQLKYEVYTKTGGYHYIEPHRLGLYPMKEERNITLTLEKAKEWYKKGGELKEIALQAFSEKELNPLPRSWEEFCTCYNTIKDDEHYIDVDSNLLRVNDMISNHNRLEIADRNIYPSKKSAEAHLAMIQLEQLRNCWWNGWEPIWDISQKYCIYLSHNEVQVRMCTNVARFLTFPTREMAIEFLECFRDLIELARNLI